MKALRPTLWRTCRVIANTTRLKLLWAIFKSEGLCVNELSDVVGTSRTNTTNQLRALSARGLITPVRIGKKIVYRAEANHGVDHADELLDALRKCCARNVSLREVFRQATAFTHVRRIELVRMLGRGIGIDELSKETGLRYSVLQWNLTKLQERGFIRDCSGCYIAVRPKNPLGACLSKIVLG